MEDHRRILMISAFLLIAFSLGTLILHGEKRSFVNKLEKALKKDDFNIPAKTVFGDKFDTLCVIDENDLEFENRLFDLQKFDGYRNLMRSYASFHYLEDRRAILFLIKNNKIKDYFYIDTYYEINNKRYNLELTHPQTCYNLDKTTFYRENNKNTATYNIIEIDL